MRSVHPDLHRPDPTSSGPLAADRPPTPYQATVLDSVGSGAGAQTLQDPIVVPDDPMAELEAVQVTADPARGAVVVGVDGSPTSDAATLWAAAEAVRRAAPLHVVCAREDFVGAMMSSEGMVGRLELGDDSSAQTAESAASAAREAFPALRVTTATPYGRPARHLVEASAGADLVVVGSRGQGRLSSVLLGTTSLQTVSHAHCPVVVIREPHPHPGTDLHVVVGVDGSERASAALRFAAEAAGPRGTVEVVYAWWLEVIDGVVVTTEGSPEWRIADEQHRILLERAVGDVPDRFPDIRFTSRSVRGHAAQVLVEAAHSADLLVVCARGRGGFAGLLLGSVSQRVLESAPCPVAVTRAG